MSTSFRHTAAFGKRMEYYVIGLMLKEGLDVYIPMVDDDAVDAVVKKPNGEYVEIQIKARSNDVKFGSSGLFAAIPHEFRPNYWFVFYSQRMETIWIMSSQEFIDEARQNQNGKNAGKRTIKFNGQNSKLEEEHVLPRYEKYVENGFNRIKNEDPNP